MYFIWECRVLNLPMLLENIAHAGPGLLSMLVNMYRQDCSKSEKVPFALLRVCNRPRKTQELVAYFIVQRDTAEVKICPLLIFYRSKISINKLFLKAFNF